MKMCIKQAVGRGGAVEVREDERIASIASIASMHRPTTVHTELHYSKRACATTQPRDTL